VLCTAAGVDMAHHEESQIARHLFAGVRRGTYVECFTDPARDPVWQTMWANRPTPRDGWFDVGSEAGFGILLDEGMLERYRVG
jgi:D-galactarolactone cycloisomerase